MSQIVSQRTTRARSIVIGIARIATGHADGLAQFGDTPDAFLHSLAPLLAFPLVGAVLLLVQGGALAALSDLLTTLCGLLAPPVLTYEAARFWGRSDAWLRFAVAFNWCQWAIPVLAMILVVLAGMLLALGVPSNIGLMLVIAGLAGYGMWLHWFLARNGLGLGPVCAALLVVVVNLATVSLVLGPTLVAIAIDGKASGG
jgi:hypothetical protein